MSNAQQIFAVMLFLALSCVQASAAEGESVPLFADDTILEVQLTGPLEKLLSSKKERNEFPFVLTEGDVQHPVKVRVRGNSRLKVCDFPPLRINFKKSKTGETVFSGQDKLKLVTHCKKSDEAEINILQEYAAYRIFNLISDVSYRVRLIRMTYTNSDDTSDDASFERSGFVVESARELADRAGGKRLGIEGVPRRSIDEDQAAAVFVFQYLIGNTDWAFVAEEEKDTCCHNGDLLDIAARFHYVPYDFDLAGLVDASYAYPDPSLRIRKVTQRLYRGLCLAPQTLVGALQKVKARQSDILQVMRDIPGLSDDDVEASITYLQHFFARAENEEALLETFALSCL